LRQRVALERLLGGDPSQRAFNSARQNASWKDLETRLNKIIIARFQEARDHHRTGYHYQHDAAHVTFLASFSQTSHGQRVWDENWRCRALQKLSAGGAEVLGI
jgi:hypothetical protein